MSDEANPLPEHLSDEAAFALSEALHWLAMACEEKYFAQIKRHLQVRESLPPANPEQPWES